MKIETMKLDRDAECALNWYNSLSDISEQTKDSDFLDPDHDKVGTKAGGEMNGSHDAVPINHDHLYNRIKDENRDLHRAEQSGSGVQEQSQDPELDLFSSDPPSFCEPQSNETTVSCPSELRCHDVTEDAAEPVGRSTPVSVSFSSSTLSDPSPRDDEGRRGYVAVPSAAFQRGVKRRRTEEGKDVMEALTAFRIEQVANFIALSSQIKGTFSGTSRRHDEFANFARAVADSLRKLPADRVEAAKSKVFAVLAEAHDGGAAASEEAVDL